MQESPQLLEFMSAIAALLVSQHTRVTAEPHSSPYTNPQQPEGAQDDLIVAPPPPGSYSDAPYLLERDLKAESLLFRNDVALSLIKQAYNPAANREMYSYICWYGSYPYIFQLLFVYG